MKILQRLSYIDVIGRIWMPPIRAATRFNLDAYAINNMREEDGTITRDSVEQWLTMHSGDFQVVTDFCASIEDGPDTIDLPWANEDSEPTYNDCMFPYED